LPIFHESFLLTPGFFSPENGEIPAPPPCGFLVEIYLFFENWSTETFRKKESEKWAVCSTYKPSLLGNLRTQPLLIEINENKNHLLFCTNLIAFWFLRIIWTVIIYF
jgi:hypothetical protein